MCCNVPIARIGAQKYAASELEGLIHADLISASNSTVTIYRRPEDVFDPAAMASFNGKPITDEHPSLFLTAQTAGQHSKGHAQNIRQEGKYLMADLIVTDPQLIEDIRCGRKREVSAGYNARYSLIGGLLCQTDIVGNHIAVTSCGRAGSAVAIKDSIPEQVQKTERTRGGKMAKRRTSAKGVAALFGMVPFFKDSAAEEAKEALIDLAEEMEQVKAEAKEEAKKELLEEAASYAAQEAADLSGEPDYSYKALIEAVTAYGEKLDDYGKKLDAALEAYSGGASVDPIDELIQELGTDAEVVTDGFDEEEVLASSEDINKAVREQLDENSLEYKAKYAAANAKEEAMEAAEELKKLKPIIAAIKDSKQRKAVTDSVAALARRTLSRPKRGESSGKNGYADILAVRDSRRAAAIGKSGRHYTQANFDEITKELAKSLRAGRKGGV